MHDDTDTPNAAVSIDDKLIMIGRYGEVWNINPSSPGSITGGYGLIGRLPSKSQQYDIGSGTVHTID